MFAYCADMKLCTYDASQHRTFSSYGWMHLYSLHIRLCRKELGKGKERTGKDRKGKERKGKERKGKESNMLPTTAALFLCRQLGVSWSQGGCGPILSESGLLCAREKGSFRFPSRSHIQERPEGG